MGTHIIPLIFGKTPGIRRSLILQIALREIHLLACAHGEQAVDGACWGAGANKTPLVAVDGACRCGSVSPHIIGGAFCEVGQDAGEAACARAVVGMTAAYGRA